MLIDIDKNIPIQKVRLSIAKPNKQVVGVLKEAYNIDLNLKLGNISELSFDLPIKLEIDNILKNNPHVNFIKYKYLIRLEYGNFIEWYQIENPQSIMNSDSNVLSVQCYSLPCEMRNKIIKQYKEESQNATQVLTNILTGLYEVDDISKCLWEFDYINPEFNAMYRTFEVSQKTLLDFLLADIAETFDAVIIFNTLNRTFSLYKKENIGINKGLKIDYGKLLKTLSKSLNTENFCTRLKCYGKDNLTITEINPMGKHYLQDFSYFLDGYEEDELGDVVSSSSYLTDSLCRNIIEHKNLIATKDKELDVPEIGTTMLSIKMTDHGLITGDYILNKDKENEIRRVTKVDDDNVTLDLKETSIKYALNGTTETNIHILGHNLNTGDYIVNKSKLDARRQVTKVDDDNFTVVSVLGQMIDDEILLERYSITNQASGDKIYKYKNGTFGKLLYQKRDLQKELTLLRNELNNVLNPQLYEKLDNIAVLEEIGIAPGELITERDALQSSINTPMGLISVKEMAINNKDVEINNLRTFLSMESNFTESQILELNQFIIEEVWEDNKYIDMFDLYEEGLKRFADINSPKDNIEINIVNLLEVVECQHDWNKLVIGDQIRLKNELLNIDVLFNIIDISFKFESGDIDLVIGDIKNTFSDKNSVIDKLNKAIDTTNDLNNKKINWDNIATNFDNRNDRVSTLPANPVVLNDGTAIASVLNTDGSANVKFRWSFEGMGDAYDVDGFIVYVRSTTSTESYMFGSTIAQEQAYSVQINRRTFELYGVPSNKYYTFGIQAYRKVDVDIESSGYLKSNIVKVANGTNQNPHRPSTTVSFDGNVVGTIDGKPVSDINNFIDVTYPTDTGSIQTQIDGKINSYLQEADPNDWAEADNEKHEGDMWYKKSTKFLGRYNSTTNEWDVIEDQKAVSAYELAEQAIDTADGKRRVFTVTPYPPYDIGDLYCPGSTGDLKKCKTAKTVEQSYSVNDWEIATKYTDDTNANLAIGQISDMSSDGKVTPVEKLPLKQQWDIIVSEKPIIEAQATSFGITTEKTNYISAYNTLNTYLNTTLVLFSNMAVTTNIVKATFDSNWKNYYDKRLLLSNEVNNNVSKTSATFIIANGSTTNNIKQANYVVPTGSTSAQTIINNAINSLPTNGGKIVLLEGTYLVSSPIFLTNNTTIEGQGARTKIQIASGSPEFKNGIFAILNKTKVIISNILLDGNSRNVGLLECGILANGSVIKISSCICQNFAKEGIIGGWVSNLTNSIIENCTCNNNQIRGIFVKGTGVNIIGNVCNNNNSDGICAINETAIDTRIQILNNVCENNLENGILSYYCSGVMISNNLLQNNKRNGVYLESANNCIVTNNNIISNGMAYSSTYSGVYLKLSDYNSIQFNKIRSGSYQKYGIDISDTYSDSNLVTNNDILGSGNIGSIHDAGTGTVTVAGNRL